MIEMHPQAATVSEKLHSGDLAVLTPSSSL